MQHPPTLHRDFTRALPCGCDHGHFCEEAEALFAELSRWLMNMNHPTARRLAEEWNAHFEQACTCSPDPNRESMLCPTCRAVNAEKEMEF